MKRSGFFLPFFLPGRGCIRVGGLRERRRVSHCVYLPRFFADRGRKDALSPTRCTRGISAASPSFPSPVHSGCTVHRAHSRGICGRRVEYVPGYVRRPGIPSAVFPARNVATSPGVRLREDDIFPSPSPVSPSLARSRLCRIDVASHSRRVCNIKCRRVITRAYVTDDRTARRKRFWSKRNATSFENAPSSRIDTLADANSYSSCDALWPKTL